MGVVSLSFTLPDGGTRKQHCVFSMIKIYVTHQNAYNTAIYINVVSYRIPEAFFNGYVQ